MGASALNFGRDRFGSALPNNKIRDANVSVRTGLFAPTAVRDGSEPFCCTPKPSQALRTAKKSETGASEYGTHPPFRTIPSPQAPAACSFGNTTERRGRRYRLPDHPIRTPAETGRGCSIRAAHPSPIRPGGRSDNDAAGTEAGNRHSDPTDTTKADGASAAPADTPSVSVSQSPRQATQRISNWAVRIRRNIVSG